MLNRDTHLNTFIRLVETTLKTFFGSSRDYYNRLFEKKKQRKTLFICFADVGLKVNELNSWAFVNILVKWIRTF